jgi:hypothetical protein
MTTTTHPALRIDTWQMGAINAAARKKEGDVESIATN